jgi:hypothetical protein
MAQNARIAAQLIRESTALRRAGNPSAQAFWFRSAAIFASRRTERNFASTPATPH